MVELLLNEKILEKAMKKIEKSPVFGSLRELVDFLLEQWLKEEEG